MAWPGEARLGTVWQAWLGTAGHGKVRLGEARYGRQGKR
nr:MAG TPA: hypothetical protein [Caudoviricetes sp.]